MQERVGALESREEQADRPTDANWNPFQSRGATKFYYASGDKPLEGFTIKRGIGVGGFGEVYYAISDAGKDVALKHVQRNLDVELRGVRQCLNLKHPNLLSLFDIRHDQSGQAWVIMEYVPGESLQDVIDRNPNGLPLEQVHFWFQGVAAGVAYLHDHGIVHRDLKPGNIFADEGIVKIGDYGLAKFISCSRRSGQTESVGTFHYMAPEIGRGRYGKEVDIYALGIVLYEMLTGRVPYEGESSQEIIMKHLTAEPDLQAVAPGYRHPITEALAKDPDQRFRSVGQMLGSLPPMSEPLKNAGLPTPYPNVATAVQSPRDNRFQPLPDSNGNPHGPVRRAARAADVGHNNVSPNEPIARAVNHGWSVLRERWNQASFGTATRTVLLMLAMFVFVFNASWLIPLTAFTALLYAAYFLIRSLIFDGGPSTVAKKANRPVPSSRPSNRRRRRRHWHEVARESLDAKSPRERLTELTGSLLMGAIVSAVLCLVMMIFGSNGLRTSFFSWAPLYAWMTLTTVMGTWCVLIVTKPWEGKRGEASLRRFTMLAVGLAVGAASYGLWELLKRPELTYVLHTPRSMHRYPTALFDAYGPPTIWGYLGYFAGLFLAMRWWKQADPLRPARLSILSTTACVLWSILLFAFLPFPRGVMFAATISIAIQLSSPWMSMGERNGLRQTQLES